VVARRTALLFAALCFAATVALTAAARAEERLEWPDGRAYSGSLRHGRPDGEGVQVWPDGRHYRGGWRDGLPDGVGTLTQPDGSRYVGRFVRGRATGEGEYLSPMGTRYQARLAPDGRVAPGAMLGAPEPPARTAARPDSLEAWLRGP